MAKRAKHDKYCWRCCAEDTTLMCTTCVRSFHDECLKVKQQPTDGAENWQCPVCITSSKSADSKEHLDMLPMIMSRVFNDEQFDSLKESPKNAEDLPKINSLVNLMDLKTIKNKIATYTSFYEFLVDVRWIIHNYMVLFSERHESVKVAVELVEYLRLEIESVKRCAECYSNVNKYPDDWSTIVCAKPHIVLWAKVNGYSYWPAKCISIDDDQTVNVRFFGDNTRAAISGTNCFLYSEANPSRTTKKRDKNYNIALKEADVYIENVRRKFGSYRLAETKTPFDPLLLDDYVLNLIPGTVNTQDPPYPIPLNDSNDSQSNLDEKSEIDFGQPDFGNINISSDDDEPMKKKVRFSDDMGGTLTENIPNSSVESSKDSSYDGFVAEISNTPVDQPIANDAESATATWNLTNCREVMMQGTENTIKAFEDEIKRLATEYDRKIKLFEERNQQLIDVQCEKELDAKKLIDKLQVKIGELQTEMLTMTTDYNKMIGEKDEKQMKAVDDARKQCEEHYTSRLEANKQMKFCVACDTAKPLDTFYVCNAECRTRYLQLQLNKSTNDHYSNTQS